MKNLKRMLFLKVARKMNKNENAIPVPTIISANTHVKGDIISDGVLHIDGHVEGDVSCPELVIGVKGSVTGSVKSQTMNLYGTLRGKAHVNTLFVSKSAKLIGDATHNSIAIEPGAYIDGHCIRSTGKISYENTVSDSESLKTVNSDLSDNSKLEVKSAYSSLKSDVKSQNKADLTLVRKSTTVRSKAV